jgi:hypothetical protein
MSEQGENSTSQSNEITVRESSTPNSLVVDIKGHKESIVDFITETVFKIRARELGDNLDNEGLRQEVSDILEENEDILNASLEGKKRNGTNYIAFYEVRVNINKLDKPNSYSISFADNINEGRVNSDGLSISKE